MEIVHTEGTLTLDLNNLFTMTGLEKSLLKIHPKDPTLTVIGVDFTLVGLQCKLMGIIDPIAELKEAASRIYNYAMQSILKPIWNGLYSLYSALKRFGLAVLDLKLPILGLRISDLFNPDLFNIIERAITKIYNSVKGNLEKFKNKIISILNALGIPYPLFEKLLSLEKQIFYIVKHICSSLWDQLMKKIHQIKDLINRGLELYDRIVNKAIILSKIWKNAVDSMLKKVLNYLRNPPSIADIKRAIIAFAKKVYNKAAVTVEEIMKCIKNFKLPIFGNPFDWILSLNPHLNFPDIDFNRVLSDIKLWLNNFVMNLLLQFVKIIKRILSIFGINIVLPRIKIPISICALRPARPPQG